MVAMSSFLLAGARGGGEVRPGIPREGEMRLDQRRQTRV